LKLDDKKKGDGIKIKEDYNKKIKIILTN